VLSTRQIEDFHRYARNPETWVLSARRNLSVVKILSGHLENQSSPFIKHDVIEISGCHNAMCFHAAAAVENAAKAVLIARDPSVIENGVVNVKKFGSKSGHALLDPVHFILGVLASKETRYLTKLEEFVWLGRYAIPMRADVLYDQEKMDVLRLSTPDEMDILHSLVERLIKCI
jgi:hypothetical protein